MERSDLSTLKQDDLYTRFIELCEEFFWSKDIYVYTLTEFSLDRTKLKGFFDYFCSNKSLPNKLVLMEAVQFSGRPPMPELREEIGFHLEESLWAAIAKLDIEKRDEKASLHQQQKSSRGRKADEEIRKRREIVKKHIHAKKDWFVRSIQESLLDELDGEGVPLPKNSDTFTESIQIWAEFLDHSDDWKRVVDKGLNRDRWR